MNPLAMAYAADQTTVGYDPATRVPGSVIVLDQEGEVALVLHPDQALALAARLCVLAQEVTDAQRQLRRPADVDERLRGLDE